jgi:hypothetical protein
VEADLTPTAAADVPMQRVVRIAIGAPPVTGKLAPNDMNYLVNGATHCQPCRLVRVTGPSSSTARVRLTWSDVGAGLRIWLNGREFVNEAGSLEVTAEVPIGAGEAVIFVGRAAAGAPQDYVSFALTVTGAESAALRD